MDIINEKIVTDAESKEILEKGKEEELKYEQRNALDILKKFADVPSEKINALIESLKKIEKLRDRHLIAIANFLPDDKDDLRAILHKEYSTFTEDELNLILETVRKAI